MIIEVLAGVGILLSFYASTVTLKLHYHPHYKPWCDHSYKISCSRAFASKYRHIVGIPNAFLGLLFYLLLLFGAVFDYLSPELLLFLTALGATLSLGLTHVSIAKLRTFCSVCVGIHLVNFLLLIIAILRFA